MITRAIPKLLQLTLGEVTQANKRIFLVYPKPFLPTKKYSTITLSPLQNSSSSTITNDVTHLFLLRKTTNRRESSSGGPLTCWKCQTKLDINSEFALLVCPKCQSPQRLRGTDIPNYYELLGHGETYRVDLNELSLKVKRLQRKLHPDLYTQKGKEEQELSQELSSLVNKAFGTLSNPIERGRYLLKLNGIDDPAGDAEKELTNDPEFLEEVMDLNERLEELSSEKDWMDFRKENEIAFTELQKKLENAFETQRIKDAQIIIGRMKYYHTLEGKLKELKSKLGIVE